MTRKLGFSRGTYTPDPHTLEASLGTDPSRSGSLETIRRRHRDKDRIMMYAPEPLEDQPPEPIPQGSPAPEALTTDRKSVV